MTRTFTAVALAVVLTGPAPPLSAQAVCSAPHSSPMLTQSGAVGTLPAGAGWGQLSLYQQRSREFFGPGGERRDFLANSEFLTRSVFFTAAVGILDGLEAWAQAPLHRLTVESSGGGSQSTGFGDIRLAARIGPELFGWTFHSRCASVSRSPAASFPWTRPCCRSRRGSWMAS